MMSLNVYALQQGRGVGVRVKDGQGREQQVQLYTGSYALLIGVSSYDNGWNRLRGVNDDVPEVRNALERQGFVVEELRDPTRKEFREKLDEFTDKYGLSTGNRLLIYFAGHGHTMKAEDGRDLGYVVMRDAPLPGANLLQFQQRAISMDEVEVYARRIVSIHALFVFDSCFSGKLVQRSGPAPTPYISEIVTRPVRQFITSGAADQTVPDQSVFRAMFVRGIDGESDLNHDGYVTGSELALYLQQSVTNYTDRAQTPQYGKIKDVNLDRGDFVFIVPAAAPRPAPVVRTTVPRPAPVVRTTAPYLQRAEEALRRDSYNEVIRAADEALKIEPNNGVARRLRGSVYYNQNNPAEGEKEGDLALGFLSSPRTAQEYEARGWVYRTKGENDRAISDLNEAIRLDPKYVLAYFNRGSVYSIKRDNDRAISDYNEAIRLDPKYAEAYTTRGIAYSDKGDNDRAISDYSVAIRLNPKLAPAYENRAKAYRQMGKIPLAEADERAAAKLSKQ